MLVGMIWVFATLLFGPKAGQHLLKSVLKPFGCIFKFCLVIFILCVAGVFFINQASRVRSRGGQENIGEADSKNRNTQNIREPMSFYWPLPETFHKVTQSFGVVWSANASKRHTGIDIKATKDAEVRAAKSGTLKMNISLMGSTESKKEWGYCIVLAHDNDSWTTSYLHIQPNPNLKIGDYIEEHDLIGWVYFDHLHFGIRKHPFNSSLSMRGALPIKAEQTGDPAFPEHFVDPKEYAYQIRR